MRSSRLIIVLLWMVLFINSSKSHDDHEHDLKELHHHDISKDEVQHNHELSHEKEFSKLIRDLQKYCTGKHTNVLNHSSNNASPDDDSSNLTMNICPSLLHLMKNRHHHPTDDHNHDNTISPAVWGYAILACVIISLVGLLAVSIIPLMHKVIYNHLLQFLVSLAIGSLAGDALLHLIPHALAPHDHNHHHHHHELEFHDLEGGKGHDDRRPVWLGLMALGGLFVFFLVERLVGYCSEVKRKRNKGEKYKTSDVNSTNGMVIDAAGDRKELAGKPVQPSNGSASCEEMLMVVHASKDIKKMAHDAHEEMHKNCDTPAVDQVHMVHSRGGHHHHSHQVPGSVAAVAWMVIVGDGFHNFADGLAIGSAFASSIQDGLSTTIAIFCHELPHELGDFAMLLSAGMSGKQALVYNCVSSVLCLVGMCVGVGVSNLVSATPWIFMAIAGMFIYIALVDMLPEMKSVDPKRGEHPLLHLGLQVMGMLTGCSIMLIIALFEHHITIPM